MSQNNPSTITLGAIDNTAEVFLRKSSKAKRVIIRFREKGIFELIVPRRVSIKNAINFLYKKEDWVLDTNKKSKHPKKIKLENGVNVPILGDDYTIKYSGALRGVTEIVGNDIIVHGVENYVPRKIKQFIIAYAKKEISGTALIYSKKMGLKFKKITLRDTESRWGSCSHSGNLSFSWRLIFAPREVLEYVIIHELAHLKEMNHSKKFWHLVGQCFPAYKLARSWLKAHGASLHAYTD